MQARFFDIANAHTFGTACHFPKLHLTLIQMAGDIEVPFNFDYNLKRPEVLNFYKLMFSPKNVFVLHFFFRFYRKMLF